MKTLIAALALATLATPAFAGTINPYTNLNLDRPGIEATYPTLTPAEVDELVFDIADINSMRPQTANVINPYEVLDLDRLALSARYPGLNQRELDILVFKIADINSLR